MLKPKNKKAKQTSALATDGKSAPTEKDNASETTPANTESPEMAQMFADFDKYLSKEKVRR